MSKKKKEAMTEKEFLDSLGSGESLKILRARHKEDAISAEAKKEQALVSAVQVRIRPGRPPKGEESPVKIKAIKMPEAFWVQLELKAQKAGLSSHAAMRTALLEWATKH